MKEPAVLLFVHLTQAVLIVSPAKQMRDYRRHFFRQRQRRRRRRRQHTL